MSYTSREVSRLLSNRANVLQSDSEFYSLLYSSDSDEAEVTIINVTLWKYMPPPLKVHLVSHDLDL